MMLDVKQPQPALLAHGQRDEAAELDDLGISVIGGRVILVVIFDTRSSLGLVRLRVKKASDELNKIFDGLLKKVQVPGAAGSPFAEITDDDIDNLFSE